MKIYSRGKERRRRVEKRGFSFLFLHPLSIKLDNEHSLARRVQILKISNFKLTIPQSKFSTAGFIRLIPGKPRRIYRSITLEAFWKIGGTRNIEAFGFYALQIFVSNTCTQVYSTFLYYIFIFRFLWYNNISLLISEQETLISLISVSLIRISRFVTKNALLLLLLLKCYCIKNESLNSSLKEQLINDNWTFYRTQEFKIHFQLNSVGEDKPSLSTSSHNTPTIFLALSSRRGRHFRVLHAASFFFFFYAATEASSSLVHFLQPCQIYLSNYAIFLKYTPCSTFANFTWRWRLFAELSPNYSLLSKWNPSLCLPRLR